MPMYGPGQHGFMRGQMRSPLAARVTAFLPATTATQAAPWFAKLMAASYSGPLFQVTRLSDSATMDVYPAPGSDLPNYAAVDAFTGGVDSYVTIVYAQDGTGFNLTQPTLANAPTLSSLASAIYNGVRPFEMKWEYQNSNYKWFIIPTTVTPNHNNMGFFGAYVSNITNLGQQFFGWEAGSPLVYVRHQTGTEGLVSGTGTPVPILRNLAGPNIVGISNSTDQRIFSGGQLSINATVPNSQVENTGGRIGGSVAGASLYAARFNWFGGVTFVTSPGSTDANNVIAALSTAFGFPALPAANRFVYGGSSLIEGWRSTRNQTPPMLIKLPAGYEAFALGVGGQTLATEYANRTAAGQDFALYDATKTKMIYMVDAPSNDIAFATAPTDAASANSLASSTYTTFTNYVAALKAQGSNVSVIGPTIIGRNFSTWLEYARNAYNAMLVSGASAGGYIVSDRAGDSRLNTVTATYFNADNIHPNDAGYPILTAIDRAAVLSI